MKTIIFRPLRRIKKTGKIAVASYMQWRKVKTADYSIFQLIVDDEYKRLPPDELVFNHEGKNLFWRDLDPEQIPILPPHILMEEDYQYPRQWRSVGQSCFDENKTYTHYNVRGLDCDGVPAFGHGTEKNITIGNMHNYTIEEVGESLNPMKDYELLTVGVVVKWFGWFLYQLQNSQLQIGKP